MTGCATLTRGEENLGGVMERTIRHMHLAEVGKTYYEHCHLIWEDTGQLTKYAPF